jgi:phosphonatase-like hydrolase
MTTGATMETIDLCCLDLAGTTVSDDGVVEDAFVDALGAVGVTETAPNWHEIMAVVAATMGTSKIDVFRTILEDPERAEEANRAFESAYAERVARGAVSALPGAREAISAIRAAGIKIAFITGFAPATRDAVLETLEWQKLGDVALSPSDVGRGRPAPDLVLGAIIALDATSVGSTAVCGDTASDIVCGRRAGATIVAGVLTGSGTRNELVGAGATHVLSSVSELPPLLRPH